MDMIHIIESKIGWEAIIDFQPMQPGDVPESFAGIEKSKEMLDYAPRTDIGVGIEKFIDWYSEYNNC